MGTLELDITLGNLEEEIQDGLSRLREEGPDAATVLDVCARSRQLGCGLLLIDLDADGFQHALHQSALLYTWLLDQRATQPGLDTYYLCKSRASPLLDALALNQLTLARDMGAKLDTPWAPKMEPEEDFRYFDLLSGPLLERRQDAVRLAAFERCLEEPSTRFDVLSALMREDADAFWAALSALTREWEEGIEADRRQDALDAYFAQTEASIFVEGLALVRLAELWGIPARPRLPFMPAEAFRAPSAPLPEALEF
ncbi:hypothetical protein A176_005990 [Myxococcus hansupus]|uniref:Uncharacterized protein n=1 Tax=Pseudomyxococcus hansupus TaxID=1297742 RepID=A0A0H4X5F1_9BACT|nr:immunity 49 family protein [Myxococcus hansupus]AKQ69078.1 hypothetical protein A176_005990 [Myxococcus hansupus]